MDFKKLSKDQINRIRWQFFFGSKPFQIPGKGGGLMLPLTYCWVRLSFLSDFNWDLLLLRCCCCCCCRCSCFKGGGVVDPGERMCGDWLYVIQRVKFYTYRVLLIDAGLASLFLKQTPSIFLGLLNLKDDLSKFYIEILLNERGCIALYVGFVWLLCGVVLKIYIL